MGTFNANFNAFVENYLAPKVYDTVLDSNVLAMVLLGNAKQWKGKTLDFTVQTSAPTLNGGSFFGSDTFVTSKPQTKQRLSFDPRFVYQTVVIEGTELDTAGSSKEASADLIKVSMEEAANELADRVGGFLYSDGTGNGSKDPLGLTAVVDDGSIAATYGGLSRSTYSTLQSPRYTPSGGLTSLSTLATATSATRVGTSTKLTHFTGEAKWHEYEALLQPAVINNIQSAGYAQMTRTGVVASRSALGGDIGFDALYYAGSPIVADQKCPALYWFGLDLTNLSWYGLKSSVEGYKSVKVGGNSQVEGVNSQGASKDIGLSFSGLEPTPAQYGQIGKFILGGNLVSPDPRRHFQILFGA